MNVALVIAIFVVVVVLIVGIAVFLAAIVNIAVVVPVVTVVTSPASNRNYSQVHSLYLPYGAQRWTPHVQPTAAPGNAGECGAMCGVLHCTNVSTYTRKGVLSARLL